MEKKIKKKKEWYREQLMHDMFLNCFQCLKMLHSIGNYALVFRNRFDRLQSHGLSFCFFVFYLISNLWRVAIFVWYPFVFKIFVFLLRVHNCMSLFYRLWFYRDIYNQHDILRQAMFDRAPSPFSFLHFWCFYINLFFGGFFQNFVIFIEIPHNK